MQKQQIIDEIIRLSLERKIITKDEFHKTQNEVYKKYKLPEGITGIDILERYNELIKTGIVKESNAFKKVLRKRGVRSLSGVTVISLLTESFPCPGKCIYCPTFEGLPKSYIPNEPAVQRAKLNKFDPIMQIHNRLRSLEITGHKIEKNDVRIIGGTWSCYPKDYREKFIKGIYDAFNTYDEMKEQIDENITSKDKFSSFTMREGYNLKLSSDLEEAKKINETAKYRVIGIAIETRPDWVNMEEIARLRRYGVTRVEVGYQTTIDEINILNKRGHTNKESINATRLLKDAGFKVVAHMMPNLLGSTPELDKKAFKEVFDNPEFRPDELKIYPMVVTDKSELKKIWENGGFKAYNDETLIDLMCSLEAMVPEYVRINRTYRDIPASEILHGSTLSNLRQIVENRMKEKGIKLLDIRNREIKDKINDPSGAILNTLKYEASGGTEYFMTFEDKEDRTIFSLLRLRLPNTTSSSVILGLDPGISSKEKQKNKNNDSEILKSTFSKDDSTSYSESIDSGSSPEGQLSIKECKTKEEYEKLFQFFRTMWKDEFEKDILKRKEAFLKSKIFFIEKGGIIISALQLEELTEEIIEKEKMQEHAKAGNYMLGRIGTLKEHRKEGYATILINKSLDYLIEKGEEKVLLSAEIKNIEFYKKFGFKAFGDFSNVGNTKSIHMQLDLIQKKQTLPSSLSFAFPPQLRGTKGEFFLPELTGAALIREIHTFGDQLSIGEIGSTFGQHIGFGKRLIAESEKIAIENGYKKMAVIAGVGVREYYKKRGYELEGEYMVKNL